MYIYIYSGVKGVVRRPLDVPPKREIGFRSVVRAGEAKLCERVRERCFSTLLVREESSVSAASLIDCCFTSFL